MSSSTTIILTTDQIDRIMNNWFKVLGADKHSLITTDPPTYNKNDIVKYGIIKCNRAALHYRLYSAETSKFGEMYFIILEADGYDREQIISAAYYYKLIGSKRLEQSSRPLVYICTSYSMTESNVATTSQRVIPCMFRLVALPSLYPMLGSPNGLFGMTYDYRLLNKPTEDIFNGRSYSVVPDDDVMVIVLNGLPGEIMQYKRVLFEGSPYGEYYRRQIESTVDDDSNITHSGIGNLYANNDTTTVYGIRPVAQWEP